MQSSVPHKSNRPTPSPIRTPSLARPTIAIVDPRPADYEPSAAANRDRAEVASFDTANAALHYSRTRAPDLWVVNAELADLSGYDLCRMLKERSPQTPVFLVADHYSPDLERAALLARATLFVCKPGHLEAIRQWLTARPAAGQTASRRATSRDTA